MLLLDTHVLIWVDQGSEMLGPRALRMVEQAFHDDELAISAVSFAEIGELIEAGRYTFKADLQQWRVNLLGSGYREVVLSGAGAMAGADFRNFPGDAQDRLIGGSAVVEQGRLMTADPRLLSYRGLRTVDALK